MPPTVVVTVVRGSMPRRRPRRAPGSGYFHDTMSTTATVSRAASTERRCARIGAGGAGGVGEKIDRFTCLGRVVGPLCRLARADDHGRSGVDHAG